MIIEEFVITNFGRHKEVHFVCGAPVIGVLGPNGVGKSTILDAIEYAITGDVRDDIGSYVRHGQGNASVMLKFTKNGMPGKIFRQFGKTPKRELTWDGKTIKLAKEVDSTMASIFGADKHAIANAVFINQGMLDKILFAKDAERQQMFIKLVNMAFCSQRQHIIEGKIKRLEQTIVDLGPALDAATFQFEESKKAHTQAEEVSKTMPSYVEQYQFCERYITAERELRNTLNRMASLETEKAGTAPKLQELLDAWGEPTFERAQYIMSCREADLRQTEADLATWRSIKSEFSHYDRISTDIQNHTRVITAHNNRLRELNPNGLTEAQMQAEVNSLQTRIDTQEKRQRRLEDIEKHKVRLLQYQTGLAELAEPPATWEQLNERWNRISAEVTATNAVETMLKQQEEVASCSKKDGVITKDSAGHATCGKCGLKVANPDALTPAAIKAIKDSIDLSRARTTEETESYNRDKATWEEHYKQQQALNASIQTTKDSIAACEKEIEGVVVEDLEVLRGQHQIYTNMKATVPELVRTIKNMSDDVGRWMKGRQELKLAAANLARRSEYTDANDALKEQARKQLSDRVEKYRADVQEMTRLHTLLGSINTQMEQHQLAKTTNENIINAPMPPVVLELFGVLGGNLEAVKAELSARNSARDQAIGRTEQALLAMQGAEKAYKDLVKRVETDVEKRKIVDDLRLLRDLMSNDGLPMAVVNYHFRFLAHLTQEALNQLDANFSIMLDTENPLSFKFVRLDESEHEPLPMTKLSGGQRMRLCTAFLIAVQQRLVKEVGLLVLDEPSTHLDEQGAESLAELLSTLAVKLQHTEIQIIVSDHHTALKKCFSKVLEVA